ncbi:MAG: beta-N-acetylhexosaminidase [Gammaproteobacteria bacterium]|nr:beta-N-acetylhexosaminidase [Gammaproteobacteria bacterium]MBU1646605.1 beta-N-acetylhexosaminidase [Gammaproteobacteria bacterium]MBU1972862.1 beta-N-acetylhexosaminidase [Gammaproteobacteria bacterium]
MIDIAGTALTDLDRHRMTDPRIGGVILFTRNYESPAQLQALCEEIHAVRSPRLLIAVDHEGGRVQRFREGFSLLPAMRALGAWWHKTPAAAVESARSIGFLLAAELRSRGVDLSFTPVLDLDWGPSGVIGDRAFHRDPAAVIGLAGGLIAGMRDAGMACCGKHFPGHGWVAADSHVAIPVDDRTLDQMAPDLEPYRRLKLDAVMPAHVIYPKIDARPAGFSPLWIAKLRQEFGFDGVIFSDDLSMEGASFAGSIVERVEAAANAGVDMLLVCNAPDKVGEVLERWHPLPDPGRAARIARLLPTKPAMAWADLHDDITCRAGHQVIARLAGVMPQPGLA